MHDTLGRLLHLCVETLIELHLRTLSVCTLVNLSVKAQQMVPPGTGKHNRALLTNYDLHIMVATEVTPTCSQSSSHLTTN